MHTGCVLRISEPQIERRFLDFADLLCRQNKTLQAMSELLFRQWPVVEAKDW